MPTFVTHSQYAGEFPDSTLLPEQKDLILVNIELFTDRIREVEYRPLIIPKSYNLSFNVFNEFKGALSGNVCLTHGGGRVDGRQFYPCISVG